MHSTGIGLHRFCIVLVCIALRCFAFLSIFQYMSSSTPRTKPAASASSGALPIKLASKSAAAAPKLNNAMEMGTWTAADGHGQPGSNAAPVAPVNPQPDIMQLARVGDIVAMEKLFESGEFDATYSDDEGITPLHVRTFPAS